ncbi:hypothetical protein COLO4_28776 [Corchorus olitorius]|uniref:Uncharacterized protein n=1 Tax=Corchorus olitorius TaxID=93759 RepID=A0A1R3HIG0_9ROSI|nr:hypothetical protein COLO4_28776 [Corchorus olitorius]
MFEIPTVGDDSPLRVYPNGNDGSPPPPSSISSLNLKLTTTSPLLAFFDFEEVQWEDSPSRLLLRPKSSEYPKYTPLLVKILDSLLSRGDIGDKIHHYEEVSFYFLKKKIV